MTYKIIWTPEAEKNLEYWKEKNKLILPRIRDIILSIQIDLRLGIGKPESLKYKNKNIWSRRIDKKHRLVYLITDEKKIFIMQARFHYQDF